MTGQTKEVVLNILWLHGFILYIVAVACISRYWIAPLYALP